MIPTIKEWQSSTEERAGQYKSRLKIWGRNRTRCHKINSPLCIPGLCLHLPEGT